MALLPSALQAPLLALFSQKPTPSAQESSAKMAQAYYNYALAAMAPAGSVVISPSAETLLQQTLYAAMAVPLVGLPITMATAWGLGVAAFWLLPPVVVAVPPAAGAVTQSATAAALITPALTALFLNPLNTPQITASGMSTILHAGTITVMATVAPPPGTLVPLL